MTEKQGRFVAAERDTLGPVHGRDIRYVGASAFGEEFTWVFFDCFKLEFQERGERRHRGKRFTLSREEAPTRPIRSRDASTELVSNWISREPSPTFSPATRSDDGRAPTAMVTASHERRSNGTRRC